MNIQTPVTDVVLLSIPEAARLLTISRRQYYRLVQRGDVPKPVDIFGVSRVPKHEIDAIIAMKLSARKGGA